MRGPSSRARANGIEQCKFNPRNGYFYISIPATGPASAVSPNDGELRAQDFATRYVDAHARDKNPPRSSRRMT